MKKLPEEKIVIGPNDYFGLPETSGVPPKDLNVLSEKMTEYEKKMLKYLRSRRNRSWIGRIWDRYFGTSLKYDDEEIKRFLLGLGFKCDEELIGQSGRIIFERGDIVVKVDINASRSSFPDQLSNARENRAFQARRGKVIICFPIFWISECYTFSIMKQAHEVPYRKYGISTVPTGYPKMNQIERVVQGYVGDTHPFNFGIVFEDSIRYWGILDLDFGG